MARMSDAEFVYRQDIKEKKEAGRGAFHKKGGSKSKKCNFPSDYMTKKEKMAMNGPVMSYDPNKFYEWAEFKQLPMEYQIKYVNSLLNRYNCGLSNISSDVFGLSPSGLLSHFRKANQLQFINKPDRHSSSSLRKGGIKLKEDIEKALWPNCDEIQNSSETGNGEVMSSGADNDEGMQSEEIAEPTLEEKVAKAVDTVTLLASNNVPMPPEKIDEIFIEKTGMTRKDAEKAIGVEWDNPGEPVGNPDYVKAIEDVEDSTDVQSFSIVMDHINMGIIQYVSGLFKGKKISVSFEVKEVL